MRPARPLAAAFLALHLGGCLADAGNRPPPGPSPGQWTPQDYPQPQPPQQQPAYPQASQPTPQPAPAPQPAPQAPPPAPTPFALPGSWVPALPSPIAWPSAPPMPGGWPSVPGLPGWPGQPAPVQPAPGQPPPPALPQPAPSSDVAQRCVDRINGYRATRGLRPLARWAEAEPCATGEAAADARSQKAHGSFGTCRESAQNACPNWPGPAERMIDECLRSMWDEGPGEFPAHGHYNNMVDPRATQVACATYAMPNGSLWAVQDFR